MALSVLIPGDVLATLVTRATGAGLGAYIGFVAFGAASPFLFVTVPSGMIICGAAKGIADALEHGLRDRLTAWIRGRAAKSSAAGKQQAKRRRSGESVEGSIVEVRADPGHN